MKAYVKSHHLKFKIPGGTSRGVLTEKETHFLSIEKDGETGVGECAIFRGLSYDDVPDYTEKLLWLTKNINLPTELLFEELKHYPSIKIGLEQSLLNLQYSKDIYFPSEFTSSGKPIQINGLIWMGNKDFMETQIESKLNEDFRCIKIKIGVNWQEELNVLKRLRDLRNKEQLEIRVDANGAFNEGNVDKILDELHKLQVHSIEQPIKQGNRVLLAHLCKTTPVPIALDEELIGILNREEKIELLNQVNPQYIILKPSLLGGFISCDEWIALAQDRNIGWWITSALESNIGLNAIAQYTFTKSPKIAQGLGTGGLYTNNTPSSLKLQGDLLIKNT